ncbi:hypothetical protein [Bradyrhizobium sp. sGM-13]|uniref:hypothetical protein n=1 Tax=Bradyrhizobium sp. sGM-13 TaxID=2831781 RepID=UPI001BCDE364|nr:hypothetical protein [Bradyrhizobium sp. sGM-13]
MPSLAAWKRIASEAGRFARSADPLAEMSAAGIVADPEIREVLEDQKPAFKLDPVAYARLLGEYGPLPEVSVTMGDRPAQPASDRSDYGLSTTIDVALVNEIVRAFWDARAYKRRVPASIVRKVLDIAAIRAAFDGVPDDPDAAVGQMDLRGAAELEAYSGGRDVIVVQPVSLRITGAQPASLDVTLRLRLPLVGTATASRVYLSEASVQALAVDLTVDQSSLVRPNSAAAVQMLEERLTDMLRTLAVDARLAYSLPSEIALRGRLDNTTLTIGAAAGYARPTGGRSYLSAGAELAPLGGTPRPNSLAVAVPDQSENLRIVVDERLATGVLTATIESGDLAAFANRKIASKLDPLNPAPIRFDGGTVRFTGGRMVITLDTVWEDACVAGKNLAMVVTVTSTLTAAGGQVNAADTEIDINLDNTDALVCTLLSGLLGPFGLLANTIVLGIIAAINPALDDKSLPSFLEPVLPRTELRLRAALSRLEVNEGYAVATGVASIVPNVTDWFVYLKVLYPNPIVPRRPSLRVPVADATVALYELDNPPPAGDDVAVPDAEPIEHLVGRYLTTEVRSYHPRADELLGTAATDEDGFVRFRVRPNAIGGTITTYRTKEDVVTGRVLSQSTAHAPAPEPGPDFAVTITAADGAVLTTRRLVALNASQKHAGTLDDPLLVVVSQSGPLPVDMASGGDD